MAEVAQKLPQAIAGFLIEGKIGQGAMGAVFRARQKSLDRVVALKVLPPRIAKDEKFIERFQREARASAKLNHPNIVQGIDVGFDQASGLWYFAMELVDGPSLLQMLKSQRVLPERRALEIVRDIAGALECAARAGIVHRDIKPDNILLTREGTPKLADLGLAKQTTDDAAITQSGMAVGTPHYMAPEQARGLMDQIDIRTDLYALGGTLFHLVTGRPPFEGESGAVVMAKHLTEKPPLAHKVAPNVSEATGRLVARLMAKPKEQRVQSPTELIGQIEAILKGAEAAPGGLSKGRATGKLPPVRPTTKGPLRSVAREEREGPEPPRPRTFPAWMAGLVAAVLLLAIGLAFGLGRGTHTASRPPGREAAKDVSPPKPVVAGPGALSPVPAPAGGAQSVAGNAKDQAGPREPAKAEPVLSPEQRAQEAFEVLVRFEGLAPEDKAARIERIEAFLAGHSQTIPAARARALLSGLKAPAVPVPAAPAVAAASKGDAKAEPAAQASYADFLSGFLQRLRERNLSGATEWLERAAAEPAFKAQREEFGLGRKALEWLKGEEPALVAGLEKLKEQDDFELRLLKGSPVHVGRQASLKVLKVSGGVLIAGEHGLETPIPLQNMDAQTRLGLARLGLGRDPSGAGLKALLSVLAAQDQKESLAEAREALAQARQAGLPEGEAAYLERFLPGSSAAPAPAVVGAAGSPPAGAASPAAPGAAVPVAAGQSAAAEAPVAPLGTGKVSEARLIVARFGSGEVQSRFGMPECFGELIQDRYNRVSEAGSASGVNGYYAFAGVKGPGLVFRAGQVIFAEICNTGKDGLEISPRLSLQSEGRCQEETASTFRPMGRGVLAPGQSQIFQYQVTPEDAGRRTVINVAFAQGLASPRGSGIVLRAIGLTGVAPSPVVAAEAKPKPKPAEAAPVFGGHWTLLKSRGEAPRDRGGVQLQMLYDTKFKRAVLYGGYGSPYLNDLWAFDSGNLTWTCLQAAGTEGAGQTRPAGFMEEHLFYEEPRGLYWTTTGWAFDPRKGTWQQARELMGEKGERRPHTFPGLRGGWCWDPDTRRFFGVSFEGGHGAWFFSLETGKSEAVSLPKEFPRKSWLDGGLAYDRKNRAFVLFGGSVYKQAPADDTWVYSVGMEKWVEMKPQVKPPGRDRPRLLYHPKLEAVLLVGGGLTDVWAYELALDRWSEVRFLPVAEAKGPAAPATLGGPSVYDAANQVVLCYSGGKVWTLQVERLKK